MDPPEKPKKPPEVIPFPLEPEKPDCCYLYAQPDEPATILELKPKAPERGPR